MPRLCQSELAKNHQLRPSPSSASQTPPTCAPYTPVPPQVVPPTLSTLPMVPPKLLRWTVYSPRASEAPWPGCDSMPNATVGRGVVEVAQMFDVEAVVAVRVERAGALEMRGNVVAGRRGCFCAIHFIASTVLAWPRSPVPAPPAGISFCATALQLGSASLALPVTEQFQLLPSVPPTTVLPRLVSVSPRSKQYDHWPAPWHCRAASSPRSSASFCL